jgi:hypothetical protein
MAIWQFDLTFVPLGDPMPAQGPDGHDARACRACEVAKARVWLLERFGTPHEVLEDWFVYGPGDRSRVDLVRNPDGSAEMNPSAIGFALERSRTAAFVRDPEKVLRGAGSGA